LPSHLQQDPELAKLFKAINESYNAYERDKELADRAFKISEEEYTELNEQLKKEIDIKKFQLEK
jgi:hypothetical protein